MRIVQHWKESNQIPYFLISPIVRAQEGSRKEEMGGDAAPLVYHLPAVLQLILADLFLCMGVMLSMTLFTGRGELWMSMCGGGIGLLLLICSFKFNADVIAFHRPESIFTITKNYTFWGMATFTAPLICIFLLLFGLLNLPLFSSH